MGFEKISNIGNDDVVEGEEEGRISKEVLDKTGLDSKRINDYLRYHESEEQGGVIIRLESRNMLEEDLGQLGKGETLLDSNRHTKIIKDAFEDTLRILGNYVPKEKIQRLFPGLDLASLGTYDFSLSRIRVFILSSENYNFLNQALYPDKDKKSSGGFTVPTAIPFPGSFVTTEMQVDLSGKKIVVIKELHEITKNYLEEQYGKLPRELTEAEMVLVALNIKAVIIHEIVHNLDVAIDLPNPLNEGVTEWYAQQIANQNISENNGFEDNGVPAGYPKETKGVSILMMAMLENGVSMDTIDRAFISADAQSRQQILDFLIKRYGVDQVEKIMKWDFKSPRESLKFIIDLESNQDSNLGEFLKTYKK